MKSFPTVKHALRILRRNQLVQMAIAIFVVINLTAAVVFFFEHRNNPEMYRNYGDAVWWSIVTVATVGYGDIVPKTDLGRIFASLTILSGVILISLFTATISSVFVARKIKESQGLQDIDFTQHTLLCGWNPQAEDVLRIFDRSHGKQMQVVLVNEASPEKIETVINAYQNIEIKFVRGDFSRETILNRANVKSAVSALVVPDAGSAGADEKTLLSILAMKSLNPKLKVCAHILNRENRQHVKRANADEVIVSDQHTAFFLANHIMFPGTAQVASEMLDYERGNDVYRVSVPEHFVGKTFGELFMEFKQTKNWTILGLVNEEESVNLSDILSHDTSAIDAFIERKFREAGINVSEKSGTRVNINPPFDYVLQKKDIAVILGTVE
ncbi:MAG: ion channel [Bacteriovoracaceae bacterium]|nr:ion channel [Bacteroidota bacterium]